MVSPAHRTILIADDDAGFRSCLVRRFRRRGFDVLEASDGPAALEQFQGRHIDAAILDYNMPGLTGTEILSQLGDTENPVQTHVVMLTGLILPQCVFQQAMGLGCFEFLRKPIPLASVEQVVRDAMRRPVAEPHRNGAAIA